MKTAVLVNCAASADRAEEKWSSVKEEVLKRLPANTIVISYRPPFNMFECVYRLIDQDEVRCIISAGGDGSINHLLNAIMYIDAGKAKKMHIGAVGLGSSNDFLKPVQDSIYGIPVKLNTQSAIGVDVGKVTFTNAQDKNVVKYFIINASVGVTAEANLLFNQGDRVLNRVKSRSTDIAIFYAALRTIIRHKNKLVTIRTENDSRQVKLTNASVVKNPNISGSFRYDQHIEPGDGMLGLNYCYDMNVFELLKVLVDLQRGKFSGKPKRSSSLVKSLAIECKDLVALEMDGEVFPARQIAFSVLPKAINVL